MCYDFGKIKKRIYLYKNRLENGINENTKVLRKEVRGGRELSVLKKNAVKISAIKNTHFRLRCLHKHSGL